jgi:hypothetical protein
VYLLEHYVSVDIPLNAWIRKTLKFINMNQLHSRFLTPGKSMVEITGWGLPEIISEVTPTSFNKMDSDSYILFEERNPA